MKFIYENIMIDRDDRLRAVEIFNEIKALLSEDKISFDKGNILFKLPLKNIDSSLDNLNFFLCKRIPKSNKTAGGGITVTLTPPYIYTLYLSVGEVKNFNELINKMNQLDVQGSFVHEFTHYLDFSRSGDDFLDKMNRIDEITKLKPKRKDFPNELSFQVKLEEWFEDYFNIPSEIEAYLQQAFFYFDETFFKLDDDKKAKLLSDVSVFSKFMVKFLNKTAMKPAFLLDKNREVVKQSIFLYYNQLNSEFK